MGSQIICKEYLIAVNIGWAKIVVQVRIQLVSSVFFFFYKMCEISWKCKVFVGVMMCLLRKLSPCNQLVSVCHPESCPCVVSFCSPSFPVLWQPPCFPWFSLHSLSIYIRRLKTHAAFFRLGAVWPRSLPAFALRVTCSAVWSDATVLPSVTLPCAWTSLSSFCLWVVWFFHFEVIASTVAGDLCLRFWLGLRCFGAGTLELGSWESCLVLSVLQQMPDFSRLLCGVYVPVTVTASLLAFGWCCQCRSLSVGV